MREPFAAFGLLMLISACGYNPQPGDGLLPCDHGCPTGYVCRSSENRCYHANAPMPDASPDVNSDDAPDRSDAPKDDARSRLGDGASRADGPASDSLSLHDGGETCTVGGATCSDGEAPDSFLKTDIPTDTDATSNRDTRPSEDASEDLPAELDVGIRRDVRAGKGD